MKKFLLFGLMFCSACTAPSESNYIRNVKDWVGHTPEELITRWGEPTQVISDRGKQYYIYMVSRTVGLAETLGDGGINEENAVYPLQNPPFYNDNLFCQTTFVVQNDQITNWSFEGNDCIAR